MENSFAPDALQLWKTITVVLKIASRPNTFGRWGFGVVIWNDEGDIIEEIGWSQSGEDDPLASEDMAMELVVTHATTRGFDNITMASDNKNLIDMLNDENMHEIRSSISMMCRHIHRKIKLFGRMVFQHVQRGENEKAHYTIRASAELGQDEKLDGPQAQGICNHVKKFHL
ncbi:hypothetical protein RYX36_034511 [Vicia faba]